MHILTLYLLYEHQLGEASFWKPWIDLMPDVKFFSHWGEEQIRETYDSDLIKRSYEYKETLEYEWGNFSECLSKHPDVFTEPIT